MKKPGPPRSNAKVSNLVKQWVSLSVILFLGITVARAGEAPGESATPSQKAKAAIEGLPRIPQAVKKTVQEIGEKGKASSQETLAAKAAPSTDGAAAPAPEKNPAQTEAPRISTVGKRDPFRPFSLNIKANPRRRENLSPLERYELGQLKLVGVIWDIKDPKAMIEDSVGLGYIVKVGTPIGVNDGKIKTIKPNQVVVEEMYADFYGVKKRREVNLTLSAE